MAYAIDTHASIKDLEQSGLPNKQAEAIVKLMSQQSEELLTKDYLDARLDAKIGGVKGSIAELRSEIAKLKGSIAELKVMLLATDARLDAKIGELKVTLLATMIALTGIIIAAIKFI